MLNQFQECGFDCSQHEALYQLYLPSGEGRIPMSCSIRPTPINTLP